MYEEGSGCRCMSVCVWCVCLSVRLREAMLMLKLCAYKKQLFHPPLYLSHAQKILPQTVMVPRPYLRLPWRFLHPQVGKTHSPITYPRMCPSRVGLVCHHVLRFSFSVRWMCERSEAMFLYKLHSTRCKHIKITYCAHIYMLVHLP